MIHGRRLALGAVVALVTVSCNSKSDRLREQVFSSEEESRKPATFDWSKPVAALSMDGDQAAQRVGSFDWAASVAWTVSKGNAAPIRMAERHQVRQLATGEFVVDSDLDPDAGTRRADAGKRIVYANKTTYARGRYGPADTYRERPTDRGRDARRFRDESFAMGADLAGLLGAGLVLTPAGEATVLTRSARRFTISLEAGSAPAPAIARLPNVDDESKRHFAFLDGRRPLSASGELLLDAETAVPLVVSLSGAFAVQGDPDTRIEVEYTSKMNALGTVAPVSPPAKVLPDERKPRGVARAFEAAGLRKPSREAETEENEEEE